MNIINIYSSYHKRFPNVSPRLWFCYICFHVLGTFLYGSYLVSIRRLLERSENDLINKSKNTAICIIVLIHAFIYDVSNTIDYK